MGEYGSTKAFTILQPSSKHHPRAAAGTSLASPEKQVFPIRRRSGKYVHSDVHLQVLGSPVPEAETQGFATYGNTGIVVGVRSALRVAAHLKLRT